MITRVTWVPGSDQLLGRCHCGAQAQGEDPACLWDWLLAHPGHPASLLRAAASSQNHSPPPHLVHRTTSAGYRAVPPA